MRLPRIPAPAPLVRRLLRRKTRRTQRIPAVWPVVALRGAGVVVSLTLLVFIAYEVGRDHKNPHGLWAAVTATIASTPVALVAGTLLALMLAACLRRIWFEHLVRRPGPILVGDLGVPSTVAGVDVAGLTAAFRQRLQQLRLQAPAPLPGAMPEEGFLEMLDGNRLNADNVMGTVVRLLRAAIPSHAYEVTATLVKGSPEQPEGSCGVSAELKRLPKGALPVETAWASSWEAAVIQAADIVSAAVLPLTRLSYGPPWSGWHRYVMPARLVFHFEQAEDHAANRRYDEALHEYFAALKLDPKSVDLRLEVGFVREKLGLFVDALDTYAAAVRMARETSTSLYRGRALRNRRATGRTARYRLAVLLAGAIVARQWRDGRDATERDKQRLRVRQAVMPELVACLDRYGLTAASGGRDVWEPPPWNADDVATLLRQTRKAPPDDRDQRYLRLRNVFSHLAERILLEVQAEVRAQWGPRTWLTPLVIDLTIEWVQLRRAWVTHTHEQPNAPWVPPEPRKRPAGDFRTGTERYNAACLYALPLLDDELRQDEARSGPRAKEALKHLALGVSSTTSWYVASRRDWILSEDPDLDGLRPLDPFKQFENVYFPSDTRLPLRPRNAHEWELCHYMAQLVTETARRWEQTWVTRRQRLERSLDARTVVRWFSDEAAAWKLLDKVAREHLEWPARYELIAAMEHWGGDYGFDPLRVPVPRFAWDPPDPAPELVDAALKNNRRRLKVLVEDATRLMGRPPPNLARMEADLRDRDVWGAHPAPATLDELCDVRAQLWRTLADWIGDVHNLNDGVGAKQFGETVVRAVELADAAALAPCDGLTSAANGAVPQRADPRAAPGGGAGAAGGRFTRA